MEMVGWFMLEYGLRRQGAEGATGAWSIVAKFVQIGLFLQVLVYGLEQPGPTLEVVRPGFIAPVC
jgi:hypothetical protein